MGFGELQALQHHGYQLNNRASGNKWVDAHRTEIAASLSPSSLLRAHLHGSLQGNMQVRFMDWHSDLERLDPQSRASQAASTILTEPDWLKGIPQIGEDATYDVVLGSDILYEVGLALAVIVSTLVTLGRMPVLEES